MEIDIDSLSVSSLDELLECELLRLVLEARCVDRDEELDELLELLEEPLLPSIVHQVISNSPMSKSWKTWKRDILISSEP